MWVCRDSRVSGARGAAPCCGKAANVGQRGKQAAFSLCRQALGRAHAPVRVYKCALCSKGLYPAFPSSARFFRYARASSPVKASRSRSAASSSVMVLASGTMLSKTAPRTISRWLRVRRSSWDSFCRNIFSRFSYCRIFFLSVLNLGLQLLAGFLSWLCHSWSLLSAYRHRKRTVDFSAVPCGWVLSFIVCCFILPLLF